MREPNTNALVHSHDHFFRAVMENKRVAREFLKIHLPEPILKSVDLSVLEFQPRSHINEMRKETVVDILYKTTISENEGYIYLLLEHQSSPDELMPFRLLKYTCNIISYHLKKTGQKKIPLIYPMVIYHGKRAYHYSTDINNLVNAPQNLVKQYFLKPFQLIDLTQIKDEELKKHAWAGALEFALKHVFAQNILPYLHDMADLLGTIDRAGGRDYISIVLQYILQSADLKDNEAFYKLINTKISPEVGENIMTLAERLKQEGRQEGRQEGIEEERVEIAKQLLLEKVDLQFISKITKLPLDKVKQLHLLHLESSPS